MSKHKYEVFGKRVTLDVDDNDMLRKVEDSVNDAIAEAYRNDPTCKVVHVSLNTDAYDCYVSVEVTP